MTEIKAETMAEMKAAEKNRTVFTAYSSLSF
jgi:hypothetical protein